MIYGWLLQADYGSIDTFYFIRGDGNGSWIRRGRKARALRRFLKQEMPDMPNRNKELTYLFRRTVKASLDTNNCVGELKNVGATNYLNALTPDGQLDLSKKNIWSLPIRNILGSGNAHLKLEVGTGLQLKHPFFVI